MKKTFKLPVTYRVFGYVEVEGDSLEEAVDYFKANKRDIELPFDPEYVEDSFELDTEDMETLEELQGKPLKAFDISWDVDGDDEVLETLPSEVIIPVGIGLEDIADYLSDKYGWCVACFNVMEMNGEEV